MLDFIFAVLAYTIAKKAEVPLLHKQNILKFLVASTAFAIIGFMYFDIRLGLNPLLELYAAVFVALFSVAIRKWSFANFPSTQVRLFFLAQMIVGAVLSSKALCLAKICTIRIAAVFVLTFYTYVMGLFRLNFQKFDDIGNGPQTAGLDMDPPLERWEALSIGLTCGPTARAIHQPFGHGFLNLKAPYDMVMPDGQFAKKGSLWAWSCLMDTGVEFQSAEVQYAHFKAGNENVSFVRPRQLIGKSQAELDELNERLWEEALRMYKANHECADKLKALVDKVIDPCHATVIALESKISTAIGGSVRFVNRCLNAVLSVKPFVKGHEAMLRLQRRKLNAFHQQLMAKLVAFREMIESKLEANRAAVKAKAYSYLSGYNWRGFYIGGDSLFPFWTCISFVLALYSTQLKFRHQFSLGLFGLGSGLLDWFDPVQVMNDVVDFVKQLKPGYVESVEKPDVKVGVLETLKLGWFGWGIELRKLFDALVTAIKPLLEKLRALLAKIGGIFKRKQ